MKVLTFCLWVLALISALVPGILTWFMLCTDSFDREECVSKLFSLKFSLAHPSDSPSIRNKPPILRDHASEVHSNLKGDVIFNNLTFSPSTSPKTGDVLIAVVSDWKTFNGELGGSSRRGWARSLTGNHKKHSYHVIYLVGECPELSIKTLYDVDGHQLFCLNTTDGYPPQRKVFQTWQYLFLYQLDHFKWFMKVDQDTYVNFRNIGSLVTALVPYASSVQYIGKPFYGRQAEAKKLGLQGKSYCSGMSYIVSRPALSMVGPFLASCLAGVVSNHSDTEMGRCMYRHAHVDCRPISPDFKIFNMFYARDGANVSPFKQVDGRLHVKLSETPLLPNFRAVFMHPIKDGPQMDRFHNQLRPLQIFPDASHPTALDWHYKTAQQDFRASCVNNPTLQRVLHRVELPECGPVPADRIIVGDQVIDYAYILAGRGPQEDSSADLFATTLRDTLRFLYIKAAIVKFESPEDPLFPAAAPDTLRAAMLNIIHSALSTSHTVIMAIHELTFLRCDFRSAFPTLVAVPRCGRHLHSVDSGGVLVLGTAVGSPGCGDSNQDQCCDLPAPSITPIAVLLHRATFSAILAWATANPSTPFTEVYAHLAELGYPVRLATAALAAPGSVAVGATGGAAFCATHDQMLDHFGGN